MYDAGRRDLDLSQPVVCRTCKKEENALRPANPLIYLCNQDRSFAYCKDCLDNYVLDSCRRESRAG